MIIVSNTSSISNLIIIGEIYLLQQIYPKVLIPPAVHSELTRLPTLQPTMISLLDAALVPPGRITESSDMYGIGNNG